MANFELAFRKTVVGNEGGYNPGIGEKETYMGVDRGANPDWSGWKIIDNIKRATPGISDAKMNINLAQNAQLQVNIKAFYKAGYWDTVCLDQVTDQQLANNLFDCSVNQGEGRARRFMQIACNYVIGTIRNTKIQPLNAELNAERDASYRQDSGYSEWGKVWEKRLLTYVEAA
jgi:lysozyme family protein